MVLWFEPYDGSIVQVWLCHSDARQVSDLPEKSSLNLRSMTAGSEDP